MSKIRRSNVCSSPRMATSSNRSCEDTRFNLNKSKLIAHGDFLNRVKKSLYYGRARVSVPLSDYIADTFSDTHRTYSLNRLDYATIGQLRTTPCSLILAMIYLERLKDADPAYSKHITPTELFLVSMMVATKFYGGHDEDSSINWAEYAKMTPDKLLRMELEFLTALDWKVYVSNEEFFEKVASIEEKLARRQGLTRGWFTYTELDSLLPSIKITKSFLHFTFIIGLSYTAFVATIWASVFLVSQIPGSCLNAASRKATVSDAVTSISEPRPATHSPIASDAVNSSDPATENRNNSHTHTQLINSEYVEMEMDLLGSEIDRLGEAEHNATETPNEDTRSVLWTEPGAFDWSVIEGSWATDKLKVDSYSHRSGQTFSKFKPATPSAFNHSPHANSTILDSVVLQPNSGMFQNYFNAIKMQFV